MGISVIKSHLVVSRSVTNNIINQRFLHIVRHNANRGIFYVQLDDESRAVLQYEADGKILYMQSITVPTKYKGQGLARLLAETAFAYAIVNSYYMYLRCEYLQNYYLAVKNLDLEERIVGPPHILGGLDSIPLDADIIYELPDPEDLKF